MSSENENMTKPNMNITNVKDETSKQNQNQREVIEYKDCLSCRLIGTATFCGLGAYTIYHSYVHNPKLSRGSRFGLAVIGIGFLQIGLYRLLHGFRN